jgi:hypothetical protein
MSALLLLGATDAWGVSVDFRIGHEVDLDAVEDGTFVVGDDYFVTNGVYKARWATVYLVNETTSTESLGFTDDDGEVTFNLTSGHTYHMRLMAHHDVDLSGRDLYVRDGTGAIYSANSDPFTTTSLNLSGLNDLVYEAAEHEWINLAAIGSWLIWRRPDAFPRYSDNGANYDMKLGTTSIYLGSDADSQTSVIDDARAGFAVKRVIAHELAHQMQHWNSYSGSGDVEDRAPHDDITYDDASVCTPNSGAGHQTVSKERQSGAILEGMAEWAAAVAFNNTNQGQCRLAPGQVTTWRWGQSGDDDAYSCEGYADGDYGVEWTAFGVDGLDYLGDTHDPLGLLPPYTCLDAGETTNVATELDWNRFLWDLTHTDDVPFASIVEAFADAEPWNWPDPMLLPAEEFADAFEALDALESWSGDWGYQAWRNGVDR